MCRASRFTEVFKLATVLWFRVAPLFSVALWLVVVSEPAITGWLNTIPLLRLTCWLVVASKLLFVVRFGKKFLIGTARWLAEVTQLPTAAWLRVAKSSGWSIEVFLDAAPPAKSWFANMLSLPFVTWFSVIYGLGKTGWLPWDFNAARSNAAHPTWLPMVASFIMRLGSTILYWLSRLSMIW